LKYFSSNSNLKMALHKKLLKKRLKYRHPLPPKTSFCDKIYFVIIFWTIPIKKCMNNLDSFQPNLRQSSGRCHGQKVPACQKFRMTQWMTLRSAVLLFHVNDIESSMHTEHYYEITAISTIK